MVTAQGGRDGALPADVGVAVQDRLLLVVVEFPPRGVEVEPHLAREPGQAVAAGAPGRRPHGEQHPLEDGDLVPPDDEVRVGHALRPESVALGTRPEGGVKGELPRLQFGNPEPAAGAGVALREQVGFRFGYGFGFGGRAGVRPVAGPASGPPPP